MSWNQNRLYYGHKNPALDLVSLSDEPNPHPHILFVSFLIVSSHPCHEEKHGSTIRQTKANWIGYSFYRRNFLLKHIIEGEIEGKRRRGRRRMQLLDDFKVGGRNWNLKEEALDCTSGELPLEGATDLSQERILSMTGSQLIPSPFKFSRNFFV
jgi:hypothetical protein